MKKSTFTWILRGWIGLAGLGAMLTGYVALSHSVQPTASGASNEALAPLPTLIPLPQTSGGSVQSLPRQSAQPFFQPQFRTRGS